MAEMAAKPYAVGIDIGGTKVAAGVLDRSGRIIARDSSRGHAGQDPETVIEAVVQAFGKVVGKAGIRAADIAGVGAGFAGHVHGEAGLVLTSSNLPAWDRHPLRDRLAARLGLPVILENDSNCCAWGEYRYGAGRGSRFLSYVTFSTGYGLGIVIDRRLLRGTTGTAGEIGHTVVDVGGPPCTCGKRGCVMSYACGLAISRMACERVAAGEPTLLAELCGDSVDHISGEIVAEAARRGDPAAREILETAGYYLGVGLSTIVQVLNPDRIVLGGGLTNVGDLIMEPCMRGLNENIHPVLRGSTQIVPWQLGEDGGIMGAADLVWGALGQPND